MDNSSSFVHCLLSNLKLIVELVIKFPGDSLTFQYGAIERIRSAILSILTDGLKHENSGDIYDHLWQLILRLNSNSQKYIHLLQDVYHEENLRLTVEQWIGQSVITQCLSQQLSSIENDIDLLETYYDSQAFIRMPPFYHAFMICIRSLESSDPSLLANIDPKLSVVGFDYGKALANDVMIRSYSSTVPPSLNNKLSSDDNQKNLYLIDKHRRTHSDPVYHFKNKSLSLHNEIKSNQEENLTNISYSIEFGSSYDSHTDSYLSIEQSLPIETNRQSILSQITIIDSEEKQFNQSMTPPITPDVIPNILTARLPYSLLFSPRKGQTLDNYIRECYSQSRTDVEKDNAHFYFSEAIISAIEYIKFSEKCKKYFDPIEENFVSLNNFERNSNSNPNDSSPETVALAIMERWKNYKIPTVSELFWMIPHEKDISEELPSIQDSKGIDQSGDYARIEGGERILRRVNSQWAPLCEQLIFHIHQPINRDIQLKKQDYLCAGCGRDVEKGYANRFRYCEYTGKYFCRTCHFDKKFYLPSYIITKWDFSNKHSVSNFAFDYLNRIYTEPIFNLNDLNPQLFERSNKLRIINELRWALYSLRYYILTCRFAEEKGYQQFLLTLSSYIYERPHTYSLQDLVKTKLRELQKIYEPIINNLRDHVLSCPLCSAKGFICEICNNGKNIIFPFNIQTTSVCPVCQSCFHIQCFKNKKYVCPKCQRAKERNSLSSSMRVYI